MKHIHVSLNSVRCADWTEVLNQKLFRRLIVEAVRIEVPASHMGKALTFGEIELTSLQLLGTLPELFFSVFAVLDVHTRSKPLDYVPLFVMKRYLLMQKRPICPVRAPNARFGFEWFPTRQS